MSIEEFIQHQTVSGCLTMEDRQYLELRDVERVIQMVRENLPWLRSTEALPNQFEGVLLFDDSVEQENIQWAHFNEPTAYNEAYFYVDDNIGGCPVSISPDVWWRRVEGPKDAKHSIRIIRNQ